MGALRQLWRGFRAVMEKVGNVQARLLLTVFYLLLAAPFGIGVQLWSDPLRLRRALREGSGWVARERADTSLERAGRQY